MLYFSEGYTLPNELWMQFASLISAANRANVVVDVLDARGVLPVGDQDLSAELFKKGLQMSNRMTRARSSDSASAVRISAPPTINWTLCAATDRWSYASWPSPRAAPSSPTPTICGPSFAA